MINTVFIALGSNIGDRDAYINKAIKCLGEHDDIDIDKVSKIIETKAVSVVSQPDFLNAVVSLKTLLNVRQFFELSKKIEKDLGRTSKGNQDPRTIDIDILFFNDEVISDDDLVIPHPLLHQREFVLKPFLDIAPDFTHPMFNMEMSQLADEYYSLV